ncbi:hypothetical protein ACIQCR_16955 [Streptomyces sp. NPDC093249]|uniref:hypothetical protein n=1 Tax=unclassified Streptomyces TaxID=2593676 RepID=UPI0038191968
MITDGITRMGGCGECRTLALRHVSHLRESRCRGADRCWMRAADESRWELVEHLLAAHPDWLPDWDETCGGCQDLRAEGPDEAGFDPSTRAAHRAGHLTVHLADETQATYLDDVEYRIWWASLRPLPPLPTTKETA